MIEGCVYKRPQVLPAFFCEVSLFVPHAIVHIDDRQPVIALWGFAPSCFELHRSSPRADSDPTEADGSFLIVTSFALETVDGGKHL